MGVDSEKKTPVITENDRTTSTMEILRYSVNELQRKQLDIHKHIGQLSAVMSDFEYHMSRIRQLGQSSNNELCQSLLSHLDSVILDTRSALVASSTSTNDAQEVQDLVRRLYEENQRIATHIDHLIDEDQVDDDISKEQPAEEEDHIRKAIEQIELALEENLREQESMIKEEQHFDRNQQSIVTFIQTTEQLHEQALDKVRGHIHTLREHNRSLKEYNEQIEILTKQFPQTLFLSSQ